MTDKYVSNETLAYRLDQLEEKVDKLAEKIDQVLMLFATSKRAGKWLIAAAVAVGGIITWLLNLRSKIIIEG